MQLEDFLKNQSYFSLGHLPTEQLHPATRDLSSRVKTDLEGAIETVKQIDLDALKAVLDALPLIRELSYDIQKTLDSGHRVFLSGCGATGRLALSLESLYRKVHAETPHVNQVQAMMAGGDFALVKSVENFEDFPEFGIRHLADLNFTDGDLLIAITEGGETPYVIGTVEGALSRSEQKPWFVYCNPTEILVKTVERAREVVENPRVKTLCLDTGPMALSGSTRLQAASVQMLAIGSALFNDLNLISEFIRLYSELDLSKMLAPMVRWEAEQYLKERVVLYETDFYPIAVLTDTTERSPTFSLAPFEKAKTPSLTFSLCYLCIPSASDAETAWQKILNRTPMGITWDEFRDRLGLKSILEFDFGNNARADRIARIAPKLQSTLNVSRVGTALVFTAEGLQARVESELLKNPLLEQILVKIVLNTLSLMVMGFLNRYEGNVMTWVRASNGKLVDRSLRYLDFLIAERGLKNPGRSELIQKVFELKDKIGPNDALILEVIKQLPIA